MTLFVIKWRVIVLIRDAMKIAAPPIATSFRSKTTKEFQIPRGDARKKLPK
jgi:hypothetical protein